MSASTLFTKFYQSTMLSFASSSSSAPPPPPCQSCFPGDDCYTCPPSGEEDCPPCEDGNSSNNGAEPASIDKSFTTATSRGGALNTAAIVGGAMPDVPGLSGGPVHVAISSGGVTIPVSSPNPGGGSGGGGAGSRGEGVHLIYRDYSADDQTAFGYDVNINWGGSIDDSDENNVILVDSGGNEHTFTDADQDGRYTSASGGNNSLVKNGDGTWTESSPFGRKYHYDNSSPAKLIAKSNRKGSRWTLSYDGGNISRITDP